MREADDVLSKIEVFFNNWMKTPDEIFKALKSIIDFNSGIIYYLTPEKLRVQYKFCTENPQDVVLSAKQKQTVYNISKPLDKEVFGGENYLSERLLAQNTPYGILYIQREKSFTQEEIRLFKTCTKIISSLIKDIEIAEIVKMQTEALQEGIVATDKAYKIIKTQNKKILAADKIKTKFFTNVSHELRTPLNSIIGFSELLQNPALGKINEKQKEYLKDIQTAGIHLLGMINEILDLSKIESGAMNLTPREFDVPMSILETLNVLKPLYEKKKITVKTEIQPIQICADYQKIQQILFNLINNAIKFTPEGGTITISTTSTQKYLILSVKDNGCGIDKKYHKKIFQKFGQVKETGNSTGLGLTITKELIKMHNGSISLKSEPEKGAEFIVKIPKIYNQNIA